MRIWTKTTGLIFCALLAVYNGPAAFSAGETQAGSADSASKVKVIGDAADPAAADAPSGTRVVTSDSGTFSIQISNDDSLIHVLRLIGDESQRSIIPSREVRGTVPAMDLNNVTLSEALDAILQSNGMAWQQKGNLIFVYTQKELADREKAARKAATKTFTLHYIPAADAQALIKPAESADAQVAITKDAISGIDTGDGGTASGGGAGTSVGTGGNSESGVDMIVVTDYPENLAQISKIIQEVDRRPVQILVEATIFEATLNDNNSMGIDFSLMGGVNFADLLASSTPLTTALSGTILNAVSSTSSGSTSATPTASSLVGHGYAGGTSGNYDQNVPAGGLQIGIVHDNLGVFISALESVADTTVLANPKVLVLNKQAGEVHVGQELGYQTTTVTQTTSTQTVQYLDTGTILSFRPFVGDDGYVRMEIHPEDSTGSVTNNLPSKTTSEVTSNVMIKDGNTIVIGGLFREVSQTNRNQVPILGDIPLVGALFRSKTDQTQRQEIIILLTPHIIKDDSAYNQASVEEMNEAEKMRVGVRKGMMWFGRERLAETAYENAVAEMNKPKPDVNLALWHLDCAINLSPKFIEAIDLKEKITGVQVTDVDNSTIRGFVRRQIMAQTAAAKPATNPAMAGSR
jgi:type IV pilus secretin PilQ/predicted competence protein